VTARPRHPARRTIAAAASWLALAALIAGIPAALYAVSGSPVPRTLPSGHQVLTVLTSRDNGTLLLAAIRAVTWIAWACFTLSALVEVVSRVQGRPAPRLPVIAPVQGLAAALIGAAILSSIPFPHGPRPLPQPARPAQVTAAAPPRPAGPLQAVTTAMTLHAAQSATADAAGTPGGHYRRYEVADGNDLWDIAERFLGNPEEWHQIFYLNEGRTQPDGQALTDPDLIRPGWILLIPGPAGHSGTAPRPAPARPAPPRPAPARSLPPSPAATRPGSSPRTATPQASAHPHARPRQVAVHLPSGAIIGIAVAVMVAAAAALAGIQRRRRYRPRLRLTASLRPAAPPEPAVITALRRAARPDDPATPDEPENPAEDPSPDPFLDVYDPDPDPDPDPGPFLPAAPASRPAPASPRQAAPAAPGPKAAATENSTPGLLPLGVRDDGEAAVDLAALGGLGLTGPGAPAAARAVLAGLLAQAPPAENGLPARIIIPAPDAARLLPGTDSAAVPGITVPATLDAALDDMEAVILGQARASAASEDGDDLAGTGSPVGDGGPGATLIAASSPGTEPRLRAILKAGQPLGAAAVILGPWPSGATLEVETDGTVITATPPGAGLDGIRLFTLDAAEAAAITSVLREAADGPRPGSEDPPGGTEERPAGHGIQPETPAGDGQDSYLAAPAAPAPPRSAPAPDDPGAGAGPAAEPPAGTMPPAPGTRPVRVAVLGPLRVTARGEEVSGGLRKARELLAFLAVHPDGATGEAISEALWPEADDKQAAAQRYLAVRKARDLLRAAAGQTAPMWITHAAGSYRLDPALIATDLEEFDDALSQARRAGDKGTRLAACRAAVALYRGELAEGAGYEWTEPHAETARRRALDAWTAIADILQPAEPDQALAALEAALAHDPFNEFLYQRIMRLQAAAGRPEAVRRTLALLESRLTQIGVSPGTQTRQVAAQLLGGTRQPATTTPSETPAPRPGSAGQRP
jgi:DNA-binding SARP family transcriptional activator